MTTIIYMNRGVEPCSKKQNKSQIEMVLHDLMYLHLSRVEAGGYWPEVAVNGET